jgi:hypothetical protein
MTAEPIRRPEDETDEEPAEPERSPEAQATPESEAPEPTTTQDDSLTPESAKDAEEATAAESDPNMDPDASETAVAAADSQEVATTAQAVATVDAASDGATETPAAQTTSRRRAVLGGLRTLAVFLIGAALLVGGIALGNYLFQVYRAAPASVVAPGISTSGPPAAAQEFISALAVNDADAVRSALDKEPHIDLMREMERRGIQKVDKVEVLGTSVDGPRSATEILMQFQRDDGISFAINLVILVDGGKIEGFR